MREFLKRFTRGICFISSTLLASLALISPVPFNGSAAALLEKQKPSVQLSASTSSITLPCPGGLAIDSCPLRDLVVGLESVARGFTRRLRYDYTVTGGRIIGESAKAKWDLSGSQPGTYTVTVEVIDSKKHRATSSTTVTLVPCPNCQAPCPTVNLSCPDVVSQGSPATFTVNVVGNGHIQRTYNWSVSAGTISRGQGTTSIAVNTDGLGGQTITATMEIGGGFGPECPRTASCSVLVQR